MLDTERKKLVSLSGNQKPKAVGDQLDRIHRALHAGTVDIATIDDACERIKAITSNASAPAATAKPSRPLLQTFSPHLAPR